MGSRKSKRKREPFVISSFDKERLVDLLSSGAAAVEASDGDLLRDEIARGAEVRPEEIPPDVVTMNSSVRVSDPASGSEFVYTIVFPADGDLDRGRVSILTRLGTSLLGCRIGDLVRWNTPEGPRELRVEEIIYQPESAGDFHL